MPILRWYGSWVFASANFGTFLGGFVAFLVRSKLDNDSLISWGWRVPFLAGIVVSLSGFYLKYYCDDVGDHLSVENSQSTNPIVTAFAKENRRSLLSASLVPMLWAGGFYLTYVWMAVYMEDLIEHPIKQAFAVNSASLVLLCLWFPLIGKLSDRLGRVKIMMIGGIFMGLFSPLFLFIISRGQPFDAFLAQSCLGLLLSLWGSPSTLYDTDSLSLILILIFVIFIYVQCVLG
jgi:MHS family proline/betaine transporter-like MFS transporter